MKLLKNINATKKYFNKIAYAQTQTDSTTNLLGAKNDFEAFILFLNKAGSRSTETYRRYEREILRFSLFIYQEIKINYKQVQLKHLQAYLHFIQTLPNYWLNPGIDHNNKERIFFKESVSPGKSVDQIITVLSSFFNFLTQNNYIFGNPCAGLVRSGEKIARGSQTIRFFYEEAWHFLKEFVANQSEEQPRAYFEKKRTQYILAIAYGLALRESELINHSYKHIQQINSKRRLIRITGKGKKVRQLPINTELFAQMETFRSLYNNINDYFPLAPKYNPKFTDCEPLSTRGLRFWWKSLMQKCAQSAPNKELATLYLTLPFHSIRHTALTHLANSMDIEDLAIFAGHDSIQTTTCYYHLEIDKLEKMTVNHHLIFK